MSDKTKEVNGVEIRGVETGRPVARGGIASSTYATVAYPGHDVDYPTCSMPSHTNKGCDAWDKCRTKGKGPYMVAMINPSNRKTSVHCRNWAYKYQFKQGMGYQAVSNPWEQAVENEWVDENDHQKGVQEKRYQFKVQDVKNPHDLEERSQKQKRDVDPSLVDDLELIEEVDTSPIIEEVDPPTPAKTDKPNNANRRKDNKGD